MSWDTNLSRSVSFTVKVAGVERPYVPGSITWAQDITSDLPTAVTAGGTVAHRSGSITWARETPVETRSPTPWYKGGYWLPTVGESVTIDAHDGTNTHRVFTGVVDTVEGDAHGNRSSKLVADIQGGGQIVRYQALTRYGSPVASPTGNGKLRRQATTSVWLVNEVARSLGYHATPPPPADSKVIADAPLQGATYNYFQSTPNAEMVVSHKADNEDVTPVWAWGPDGFGLSDAVVEWVPRTGGGSGAGAVGMSCVVYSPHEEDTLFTVTHGMTGGTTDVSFLRVLGDGSVRVSTYVGGTTYGHTPAATIPAGDGPYRVSVVFRGGQVHTRINGVTQSSPLPTPSTAVTRMRMDAGAGSCVAGFQVWHPSSLTDHHAPNWTPTARFRYGTGTYSTVATPSVRDRQAREVLEEYANALLSPMWVDATGGLQIVTGKGLHSQPPALTVNALSDVSQLSYTMALLDHRPTVEVSYEHAHHVNSTSTTARTVVWQGGGGEVGPDAADETFVEVPDDEEWIMPSDPAQPTRLTFDNRESFNAGAGTWWGLAEDITAPDYLTLVDTGALLVESLTPWVWKYTTTYAGANGAMQKAPTSAYIKTRYREMDLPIIRARSKVTYEERTVSEGTNPLPGVLHHDTGRWATTTAAASDLCKWVHSMVETPTPVLENLVVRFDPRVDVGIKISVHAQDVFGANFQALVLSVDHNPGDDTTTITARVTLVTTYSGTLDDVDYAHVGQSLAQWDAARSGRTLDQVVADPYTTT